MKKTRVFLSLILALSLALSLVSCKPTEVPDGDEAKSLLLTGTNGKVTYELTGENYGSEGYAEGTVKLPSDGEYELYWSDTNGKLADFAAISADKDGEYTFARNVAIPAGATSLSVYKAGEDTAVDTVSLPESKQIKETFYMDFASVSDVHANKTDKGAPAKWTAALNWFTDLQLDYVLVSGDLTNDGRDSEYQSYMDAAKASTFPYNNIFESRGNHDIPNPQNFIKYTSSDGEGTPDSREVRPSADSPYYYILMDGGEQRDNLFIFLCQEMSGVSNASMENNFSDAQLDWFEGLLETYSKTDTNIFVINHTMFYSWGPGDRYEGSYVQATVFSDDYTRNLRYRSIVSQYKECIVMSGHSHTSLYENLNFDDEDGTAARMIHNGSTCEPRVFIGDSLNYDQFTETYGSEAYAVKVYPSYIIYNGANVSDKLFIPESCYILEAYSEDRTKATAIEITSQPDKLNYAVGDYLDTRGLTVTATLADGSKQVVRGWTHDKVTSLKTSDTTVTVSYGSATATLTITVGNNYTNDFEGEGTVESPYLIQDADDFLLFTENMRRSTGVSQQEAYGYGLFFRQTANIDMTGIVEYDGLVMNDNVQYGFSGVYDGAGHSISMSMADLKSFKAEDVSVFPNVSGVIMNLEFGGAVEMKACQPIYSVCPEGLVLNCINNMDLDGGTAHGLGRTNNGIVSRYYVAGLIHADKNYALVATKGNGSYIDVYTNTKDSNGNVLTSAQATAVTSAEEALSGFSSVNADVLSKLSSFSASLNADSILPVSVSNGQLRFTDCIISAGNNIALNGTAFDDMGTSDGSKAFDGDTSSYWQYSDEMGGTAWLGVEFGASHSVNGAKIYWEKDSRAVAGGYVLQYTTNGTTWQNVPNVRYSFGDVTDTVEFGPVDATAVRVLITSIENTKYMPKIYEFEVYGN